MVVSRTDGARNSRRSLSTTKLLVAPGVEADHERITRHVVLEASRTERNTEMLAHAAVRNECERQPGLIAQEWGARSVGWVKARALTCDSHH